MSASTKKKHVFQETINNYTLPTENQSIVRVKAPRGNNLHDVETPSGETYIVSMPVKFRKSVWTKRGDYLIVEPIEEGNKVKAEIVQILYKDHIKYIKSQNAWPKEFDVQDEDNNNNNTNDNASYISKDMLPSSSDEDDNDDDEYNEEEDIKNDEINNLNQKRLNQNDLFSK